jgi:chorismate mutase
MGDDINQLRKKIDTVDEQILQFLSERVRICELIGSAKKAMFLPIHDKKREEEVFRKIQERSAKLGLNPSQVEAVYREIVNMCSTVQE